jgi:pantoate--beta-alanine ligase
LIHQRAPAKWSRTRHIEGLPCVQIIRNLASLRTALAELRAEGEMIALVPTMGALHDGHMALVEGAKHRAAHVVVSIFVNPKQFGPNEDLAAYPRREARDAEMLEAAGVAILWAPPVGEMYPPGFATNVAVEKLGDGLCGAARPGHFDGVATVVAKLFNQVRPDIAVFGEKDWQQLAIVRRMASDLDMGIHIVGLPTRRAADGLALSSRNAYLSAEDRTAARALPRALGEAATAIERGDDVSTVLTRAKAQLAVAGFGEIDYLSLVDAATLEPMTRLDRAARLLAAARIGGTRLIDNMACKPPV